MSDLRDRYFDCARFFADVRYVMELRVSDLLDHLQQAQRITKAEAAAASATI